MKTVQMLCCTCTMDNVPVQRHMSNFDSEDEAWNVLRTIAAEYRLNKARRAEFIAYENVHTGNLPYVGTHFLFVVEHDGTVHTFTIRETDHDSA